MGYGLSYRQLFCLVDGIIFFGLALENFTKPSKKWRVMGVVSFSYLSFRMLFNDIGTEIISEIEFAGYHGSADSCFGCNFFVGATASTFFQWATSCNKWRLIFPRRLLPDIFP